MSKDKDQELTDLELFKSAVGEVKPVANDRVATTRKKPAPRPLQFERDEQQVMRDAMRDDRDPDSLDSAEQLSYARAGVQRRVMKKLRNGYYAIRAELDLHGMTQAEARLAMIEFIDSQNSSSPHSCVKIVHGKGQRNAQGQAVLKTFVAAWLRQRREILAYHSARPAHGGTGALYVLLRRPAIRNEDQ